MIRVRVGTRQHPRYPGIWGVGSLGYTRYAAILLVGTLGTGYCGLCTLRYPTIPGECGSGGNAESVVSMLGGRMSTLLYPKYTGISKVCITERTPGYPGMHMEGGHSAAPEDTRVFGRSIAESTRQYPGIFQSRQPREPGSIPVFLALEPGRTRYCFSYPIPRVYRGHLSSRTTLEMFACECTCRRSGFRHVSVSPCTPCSKRCSRG